MTRLPQGKFLLISFFFLRMGHSFLFLCMTHKFLRKTGHFEYYDVGTLEISFIHLPTVCCYCLLWVVVICLVIFLNYFVKSVFFAVCGHWNLCSFSLVVRFDRDFLKCLGPKGKKNALPTFADLLCVVALLQVVSSWTIYNSVRAFTSYLHGT